jgi:hypothetical protein
MENNKYLNKVLDHLVRGTKLDYENERVIFPRFSFHIHDSSLTRPPYVSLSSPFLFPPSHPSFFRFSTYCRNTFGLTEEEIEYVWKEYVEIIKEKIKNGQ